MPVAVGETFERYEIESLIGRGGMGEVYRAVDTRLRRKVALKILRPDRDNAEAVARLFREARSAAVLTHPNTVAIHDIGEAEGIFYIVMELVTGASLLAYVGDDRVPVARKLAWLVDAARALGAAHKTGIIHRDVKPSNIMVSDDGIVKVLDFGLAKPLAPVSFRTQAGHVLGTPRYMAPEQLAGAEIDARTDQYAYGLTAYELVAGKHPGGVLAGPVEVPLLDAIVPDVSRAVAQVIARAMANAPEQRFASMEEVAVALEDAIARRPVRGASPEALPPATREPSEITALEAPATEATITDTVRFAEASGGSPAESTTAATTKRAGGAGAAVVVQIEGLPAAASGGTGAGATATATASATATTAESIDFEADRPTVTARPAVQAVAEAAPQVTLQRTLVMADAPKAEARKADANVKAGWAPERTLLSADAGGPAAPVAKTLLAGGVVPADVAAVRDQAVRQAKERADAKAKADADAPLSALPDGVPARRSARLAVGVAVLALCAFGAAYFVANERARPEAAASGTNASAAASTSATAASATSGSAAPTSAGTPAATATLSMVPLGSMPLPSASVPTPATPVRVPRRPPQPTAMPSATSSPLDMKIR